MREEIVNTSDIFKNEDRTDFACQPDAPRVEVNVCDDIFLGERVITLNIVSSRSCWYLNLTEDECRRLAIILLKVGYGMKTSERIEYEKRYGEAEH